MKDVRIESCDTVMRIDNCDYASFFGFSNVTTGSSVKIEKSGRRMSLFKCADISSCPSKLSVHSSW